MDNIVTGLSMSVIGMVIVMSVLALLCLIVNMMKYLGRSESGAAEKEPEPSAMHEESSEPEYVEDAMDDGELVAVITAAICAMTGRTADSFAISSITAAARPGRLSAAWNQSVRREQQTRIF